MDELDAGGDETISLSDVLVARDACLPEDELWALCRECCLVLEVVNNSPDAFQTLCVTPDTVAFDQVGNVCFLDLDVEPEHIYLAPEYSENGNSYKAHLFSLGMTLLYAAEYNVDHSKETISAELREVLGRMTADNGANRPDLESTIILCEEQLCGQSSQEVCCGIAAIAGFGLPPEEPFEDTGGTTSYISNISPEDYSHAESFVHSDQADTTCCDDIPDLTEDVSQADSLPLSSDPGEIIVTDANDDSLPLDDDSIMENRRRRRVSPQEGKSGWGLSDGTQKQNGELDINHMDHSKKQKPALPKKPQLLKNSVDDSNSVSKNANQIGNSDGDLVVSELMSESDTDHSRNNSDKSQGDSGRIQNNGSNSKNIGRSDSRKRDKSSSDSSSLKKSNSRVKDVTRDKNQNITNYQSKDMLPVVTNVKEFDSPEKSLNGFNGENEDSNSRPLNKTDNVTDSNGARSKRNKRKQGLTITDILDALNRTLNEEELWALCKEGTAALQRKKKHLPAYLSPDTLLIRESGNVSFKAIPEEKPLEVIFMAPELQSKGELSEKTCLYGLSVTLRCAAGKKYSSVSSMNVSQDLRDLLQYLADSNPVKRPELADIAKVCNEHSNGTSLDNICSGLFQEAFRSIVEKEENQQQQVVAPKVDNVPTLAKPSAFKPTATGSSFQPVKPAPIGSNLSGGAFCPVPKKQPPNKTNDIPEPRIPSAFSSPATHFKPIILQTASTTNEKQAQIKEEVTPSKTKESKMSPSKPSSTSTPQKNSSPDNPNDKDKEVVKKLKELKKNLMKHRQPTIAKDIENEDKKSDSLPDQKSSTPNKKSLPEIPKKSSTSRSNSGKKSKTNDMLDSLLKEMQKQGNAPDTQSLAAAIAQHLQGHLGKSQSTQGHSGQGNSSLGTNIDNKPKSDLDMTVTSAQAGLGQGQMLPNLDIPSQFHAQLLGQTMTLPLQYGGSMISGLPQFQFQQDPVTGFLQLVPVPVSMRPHSVHSNSGSVHSNSVRDFVSPTGSVSMMKDSPHLSPKTLLNQSDVSNVSAISDPTGSKVKGPHGRTARDLVQKTANLRAKNLGRPSPLNVLNVPKDSNLMYKWKSDHALDRVMDNPFLSDTEKSQKHKNSMSSLSYPNKLTAGFVYDDSMLNINSHRNAHLTGLSRPPGNYGNGIPNYRSLGETNRHKTHSNSSSPSPSKDSGVSGMNMGAYRALPPGTDASLMERLLNNVNVKQQRVLGRIVHLLREEFAFDGYMENGVEDVAMAEYISSLGVLKWETFTSAICEKYSDLYWGTDLLANLYHAVNGNRPPSGNRTEQSTARKASGQKPHPKRRGDNDDDSSGLSEPNDRSRKTTHDRLHPELSPQSGNQGRPKSAQVGSKIQQVDTSDSTDNENYGKRRRIKRKHELDRIKNSSSNNSLTDNTNSVSVPNSNTSRNISDANIVNVQSTVMSSGSATLPGRSSRSHANTNPSSSSLPQNTPPVINRQHSLDGALSSTGASQNLANSLNLSSSFNSQQLNHNSSQNANQLGSQTILPNHYHHSQMKTNGTAPPQGQTQVLEVKSSSLTREVSLSSHSSSQSDVMREGDAVAMEKKSHVVYHWAMIQLSMSPEMERFMQDIDEENSKVLLSKLSALEQQIKMEKRVRRKTQKFYKNLVESNRNIADTNKNDKVAKGERNQVGQIAKDITEMTQRISFIELCKTHLQMLLAELQGIDVSYLYSIAICSPEDHLQLHPRPDNPLLQFQTLREPHTGCEIQALHAGTPEGLMAYLFASTALSEGFMHQFLFCYRYFTTTSEVLMFLISRYISATKSGSTETNIVRLQQRVIDLVHFWLEGYFSIDFQGRPPLVNTLRNFIKETIKEDSEGGQSILALLSNCTTGNNLELSSADPDDSEMHFWHREEPKVKWQSFKSLVRGKSNGKEKAGKVKISAVCVERRRRSAGSQEALPMMNISRRTDTFVLADYTSQNLAEQLCLIEQGIFQLTHPVHYLDSKSRGVGVAMTMKGTRTPAPMRRSGVEESFGLFNEALQDNSAVQKMIDHAQEVSHWVAAEIVMCSNPKTQLAVLSKFLFIAHTCMALRNFATTMAILDGLENLIIKQLPAWKNLPAKCASIMEELDSTRMFLKNDPLSLMQQGKDCHYYPTIPSAVFFLLHIQQLEIGGFKLANQMYKWGKIRSIAQVIDQIRIFREHMYGFEADHDLQDILRRRVHEMTSQDIHSLADQHDINYQKMPSGSGISGAFKKMKGKLQAK